MELNRRNAYVLIVCQFKIIINNVVSKVETDIITSIAASPVMYVGNFKSDVIVFIVIALTGLAAIPVIMSVSIFKTVVIIYTLVSHTIYISHDVRVV